MILIPLDYFLFLVERKKETVGEGSVSGTQKRKKLEKQEEQLKNYNKDLSMVYKIMGNIIIITIQAGGF